MEKSIKARGRLFLVSVMILLTGLGSSALIYLTATNDSGSVLGYEVVGGDTYPIRPEDSKMYAHDLELYGGKANLLANEFMRWFGGLWHGKSLALTIACITIVVSLVLFIAAFQMSAGSRSERRNEGCRG